MSLTRRLENIILTVLTFSAALVWIFPLYWTFVTSIRSDENVAGNTLLIPDEFRLSAYVNAIFNTQLMNWYINSVGTAAIVTVSVLLISMLCAYALWHRAGKFHGAGADACRHAVHPDEKP